MSKRKPQFDFWTIVTIGILAVFALFLIYPLISLFVDGFLEEGTGAFTMANFTKFFGKKFYYRSLLNSLKLTVCVTICSLLIGVPLAYIMSFFKIRGKSIIEILIIISMMSPNFIGAYSWILLLGRSGTVTQFLKSLGIQIQSIYGFGGMLLVFTLKLYPFIYMYVSGALKKVDVAVCEAAESLGANNFQRVTGIILPLVLPTVLASSLLVFMRVFADFGTPMLIGEGYRTYPVVLYNQFMGEVSNDNYFAAALCVIIVAITMVFFFLQRYIARKHSYSMSALKPMQPRVQRPLPRFLCHLFVYLVVLVALLPQLTVIVTSFLKESTPGIFTSEFTLINYQTIFSKNPRVIPNTYMFGLIAIALVIVFGVLIAYLAVRRRSIITSTVDTLTMLPYIIPGSVLGICFLYAFAKPPLALTGTAAIIIIALIIRRMPYTIRSSTAIISQISPSIEEAAVSLGASELRSFREVTLPMMMPGVISGAIMSWVMVISELSSSIMLYRASTQTLTVAVYTEVIRDCFGNAAAYSTVLTFTSVLSLLLFFKLTGRRDISV